MHHRSWENKGCWCWGSRRSELGRWAETGQDASRGVVPLYAYIGF